MSINPSGARLELLALLLLLMLVATTPCWNAASAASADDPTVISAAKRDRHGFLVHTVRSAYQDAPTQLQILLPDRMQKDQRYPVLYVLPVEAGEGSRYGNGLLEVKKHDLHKKHGLICVQPTFARLPWYADHPREATIRQETYLLDVVLPFIERTYPAQKHAEGRLLLGFSKSGWGAFSLLLRHPDVFVRAAAWDAPMMLDRPGPYGSGDIFGTPENFEKYRISTLLEQRAHKLGTRTRLALLGYGNFREHHQKLHEKMLRRKVPHEYKDGPKRQHDWHSGWVAQAVAFLAKPESAECPERE